MPQGLRGCQRPWQVGAHIQKGEQIMKVKTNVKAGSGSFIDVDVDADVDINLGCGCRK
jgi:hypothetical protein